MARVYGTRFWSQVANRIRDEREAAQASLPAAVRQPVIVRKVHVNYAFHSKQMLVLSDQFAEGYPALAPPQPVRDDIALYSTYLGGQRMKGPEFTQDYWWGQVHSPVLFGAAVRQCLERGHRVFVEVGPHPVLATAIEDCIATLAKAPRLPAAAPAPAPAAAAPTAGPATAASTPAPRPTAAPQTAGVGSAFVVGTLRRQQHDGLVMRQALLRLFCAGLRPNFARAPTLAAIPGAAFLPDAPTYPWQAVRCWFDGLTAEEENAEDELARARRSE